MAFISSLLSRGNRWPLTSKHRTLPVPLLQHVSKHFRLHQVCSNVSFHACSPLLFCTNFGVGG